MKNHIRYSIFCVMVVLSLSAFAQTDLYYGFQHPQDSARTKVWWFHGETAATHEGITADLEAFREAGVGGVVYYDQVHGDGAGAAKVFSPEWWDELTFSAREARRLGLSFEINASNGYVAGGKWITPEHSMQRLECTELTIEGGRTVDVQLPKPDKMPGGWMQDMRVIAIPLPSGLSDSFNAQPLPSLKGGAGGGAFRSITYVVTPQGKARTSSMQVPMTHFMLNPRLDNPGDGVFYGCGFRELPPVGELQASDDSINWRCVCQLPARYQNLGGVDHQTVSFPATTARYFRVEMYEQEGERQPAKLVRYQLSPYAKVNGWEQKASLISEFIRPMAPPMAPEVASIPTLAAFNGIVAPSGAEGGAIDLTSHLSPSGHLHWDASAGRWTILRFVAVSTGGHTKHGRSDALGLECDKLSAEGARLQWQRYVKPVIDSIRAAGGEVEGVCMDSHEAGPQNWTASLPAAFQRLRGYDLMKFLPVMAGYVVESEQRSEQFLQDLRRTISDLITTEYYGEFARLCHEEGLTLTAQAIGGALCLAGDAIEVKRLVDKPQGEFWGYQTEGNYDIKECASAAHVYGKQIASGEAFTDVTYRHSLADIKNLADYAYAYGINEFVICAVAYQPARSLVGADGFLNTANGRQYCLNRMNTLWPMSRPFWDYQARCSWMLRQGEPVVDLGYYIGDDVPCRIIANRLPTIPQGYDFDAFGTDVLRRYEREGSPYQLILHEGDTAVADKLKAIGLQPDVDAPNTEGLYFCHRRTAHEDIYFLNNHRDTPMSDRVLFRIQAVQAELWDPVTGERHNLKCENEGGRTAIHLSLAPRQSVFVVIRPTLALPVREGTNTFDKEKISCSRVGGESSWHVRFSPSMGGPSEPVIFDQLTDWSRHDDPRIRYYSGTAIYQNTFRLNKKEKQRTYRLRFSKLAGVAEVFINRQPAGTVWCSPYEVDITNQLRRGKNSIEIRVANNLWNRLVGDVQLPESQRLIHQSHPLARPNDKLIPAGIIGEILLMY